MASDIQVAVKMLYSTSSFEKSKGQMKNILPMYSENSTCFIRGTDKKLEFKTCMQTDIQMHDLAPSHDDQPCKI